MYNSLNNTACLNNSNFKFLCRDATNTTDGPGYGHKLSNNLAYRGRSEISNVDISKCQLVANSWDLKIRLEDRDFKSLDQAGSSSPANLTATCPRVPS